MGLDSLSSFVKHSGKSGRFLCRTADPDRDDDHLRLSCEHLYSFDPVLPSAYDHHILRCQFMVFRIGCPLSRRWHHRSFRQPDLDVYHAYCLWIFFDFKSEMGIFI